MPCCFTVAKWRFAFIESEDHVRSPMTFLKWFALASFIGAITIGAVFGLLVPATQPADQVYSFQAAVIRSSTPVNCAPVPRNFSNWLEIQVIGNRTGINFQQVSVFDPGNQVRVYVPLNQTAYATYKPANSTLEMIFVPLPDYFELGTSLSITVTFQVGQFAPQSQTLLGTPLQYGTLDC
jgi:hypothetical protein